MNVYVKPETHTRLDNCSLTELLAEWREDRRRMNTDRTLTDADADTIGRGIKAIEELVIAAHPTTTSDAVAKIEMAREEYLAFHAGGSSTDTPERLVLSALECALAVLHPIADSEPKRRSGPVTTEEIAAIGAIEFDPIPELAAMTKDERAEKAHLRAEEIRIGGLVALSVNAKTKQDLVQGYAAKGERIIDASMNLLEDGKTSARAALEMINTAVNRLLVVGSAIAVTEEPRRVRRRNKVTARGRRKAKAA